MANIHWAILGTGVVANEMATALTSAGKEIYANSLPFGTIFSD